MKKYLLIFALLLAPFSGYLFWHFSTPPTLTTNLSSYQKAGEQVKTSLSSLPALPIKEEDKQYIIEDTTKDGVQITYANQAGTENNTALAATPDQETKPSLTLHFPKKYATDPIEVQIAEGKSILIQDKQAKGDYTSQSLSLGGSTSKLEINENKSSKNPIYWLQSLLGGSTSKLGEEGREYLSYTDASKRIATYYAYGHDEATGERELKNWQVYDHPAIVKGEQVAYSFTNAKLKKNENGTISVYYYGDQDLQNDKAAADVDPSLMARAQRTLAKDMGDSIDRGETPANFVIPKPYYINSSDDQVDLDWRLSMDGKDISIDFTPDTAEYPLAFDPTLSFTAPAMSNTGDVITGEAGSVFGGRMITGDFNNDGKADLVVSTPGYSTDTGRVYIFYSDGSFPNTASNADVIITGPAAYKKFGWSLAVGDLNSDGRIDLVVGTESYDSYVDKAYIFYNDGSIPTTAATADVTIAGVVASNFGVALATGDFNADGRTDLVVTAVYNSNPALYIFYNDGSIPTTVATADVTITGVASSDHFGDSVVAGDFNADGKTDLAVGSSGYATSAGIVYIFYNDGSYPATVASADLTITNASGYEYFGYSLASGDFDNDGRTDIAVGSFGYNSNQGRAYIFYNDGSIPTTSATADVKISGEATSNNFGGGLASGDLNADGRTDLVVNAGAYSSSIGRAYIFYNDGSIPTTAATADVIITGEATGNSFGGGLATGDINADGRTDLMVGAGGYASNAGRAYIFYSQNGQVNTNQNITGNASGDQFGQAMTTGDFNADGRIDLAVGAPNYSTNTGRVYIFYGDGQIPNTAGTADVTITGEATNNYFGSAMTAGDLNADGKQDLIVGAYGYSTSTGRAYIFYNDGSIPTTAATADVIITGESSSSFGIALATGDLNTDSKTDLVVGANTYSSNAGRAYIFYNDGSIPTTAATADVIITGSVTSGKFGGSFATGDFNFDGRVDIATDSHDGGGGVGYAYIFYNDGSIPTTANAADVIISDGTASSFGQAMVAGDFNADGRTDLAVTAPGWNSIRGRAYIFYNDGSIPTTTTTADVIITGTSINGYFGNALVSGDFNADGRTDLAVGAYGTATNTGQTYIFYSDGSIPTTDTAADVIITGETTNNYYGAALTAGDFNNDGRSDLVVGAYGNATNTGKVYFYETRENFAWKLQSLSPDTGGLRTGLSGTGEELKITGNAAGDQFGYAMTTGDFNADGKQDLAVGASGYNSNQGRVYIFYNDGTLSPSASGADVVITGEASSLFGVTLAAGDFNADGRTDLAVGASYYSSVTGRAYIYYNDGTFPTTATTADVIITGEGQNNRFGSSLVAGDFNSDGRVDLAIGAYAYLYGANTGRAYIYYNDGVSFGTVACTIGCLAANADIIITGAGTGHYFGSAMTAGDINADGRTDLIVGAYGANNTYIFYNDGVSFGSTVCTTDCLAANADVIVGGQVSSDLFGIAMTTGDFNNDGKIDLAVGASYVGFATGKTYIFYADGTNNFGTATCSGTPAICSAVNADVIISGESNSDFGNAMTTGDFNADGRIDLAVGGYATHGTTIGKTYIFYNDGSIPTTAATADVILTGESASNYFGSALAAGDLNGDGKTDLVVGAYGYSGSRGRAYIYTLNDPVITGEATSNSFGASLVSGDFNADGKTDLVVGAPGYSTNTGRVYIFYQDGTIPSLAASADVIITGEATNNDFGFALTAGDLNADGRTDLVVGARQYSTYTGRAYIFYNDGSIPTTAGTADVTITGEATNNEFSESLNIGDFNADGKTDLAIGGLGYSGYTGRAYIFYNDGSIPTTAATADVTITGSATSNNFSVSLASGDWNSDGRVDLAVGANRNNSDTGGAYIFYNDGSIPTTTATADVTITGGTTGDYFGGALTAGDINADGRTDLIVGAYGYSTNTGRAYIFYNDGSIPTTAGTADVTITGEATNNSFGLAMTAGDFNADGRTDLAVSAEGYSTNTGRVYFFYNDGLSFGTVACTTGCLASNADVTLTGETTSNYFGRGLMIGDFNSDGRIDLAGGARGYSTNTGRVYLFTSEVAVQTPTVDATTRGQVKFRGQVKLR